MAGLLKCVNTQVLRHGGLRGEKGGGYPTSLCDATAKLLHRGGQPGCNCMG